MTDLFRLTAGAVAALLLGLGAAVYAQAGDPPPPAQAPGATTLVFGLLPIVSPERLVRRFAPLVDYLSERLARDIRIETAPDFARFAERTRDRRRYDILFTAPHLYYLAAREPGYRALVQVDQPGMRAVIVAQAHGPVRTLADLRGRRLATTGPLALSTVLARQMLIGAGLDPDTDLTLVPTPSHNASLLSAYQGTADASALMLPVYRRAQAVVLGETRILARSRRVPHIPIAVAPWLDAQLAARLQRVLIDMRRSERGRRVLAGLDWPGFVAASEQTYDALAPIAERLRID